MLQNLSQEDLHAAIGTDMVSRLEQILPALSSEEEDPNALFRVENLIRILISFSPSQYMRQAAFRTKLLNSLPPQRLDDLCSATGTGIGIETFADKVNALVNKGWSNPEFCNSFVDEGGLPKSFLPEPRIRQRFEEVLEKAARPYKTLKQFQSTVYFDAVKHLRIDRARFLVQMPTGSGKTRTAMELICEKIRSSHDDAVVVWLAHSEELCEQCLECFKEVWEHIGDRPVQAYRCWGTDAPGLPYDSMGSLFIVAGFQKIHSLLSRNQVPFDELKKRVCLVVVDEAHKVMAPTYREVTRALMGERTQLMGLTATPGRTDEIENQALADFFFSEIVGISAGDEGPIKYLRSQGVLSRVTLDPLVTSPQYELTAGQRMLLEERFDFPESFLREVGKDDIRNIEITKKMLALCEGGSQILFFATSVWHSRFICALLTYHGVRAVHVDGTTPRGERRHVIEQFRSEDVQVLCNYGVLATGFDAPKTDVVFVSRPTKSVVLYSQMIGRGLRGPAIGGTETCRVVTVVDNIVGLPSNDQIYDYFQEYWDD